MRSLITSTPEHKYSVEIAITEATMERLEQQAQRLGTTVEQEIETLLEADTLAELGGIQV